MTAPTLECDDLLGFVSSLSSAAPNTCDVYGVPMRNLRGERAVYVGRTRDGDRPEAYLDSLAPPARQAAEHSLAGVPGRLAHLWRQGFYYHGDALRMLRGVPLAVETAAARALEDLLGEGRAVGGVLALDPNADGVRDACKLMQMHDRGLCVKCSRGGHGAQTCDVSRVETDSLPLVSQRTKRKLAQLEGVLAQESPARQLMASQSAASTQGAASSASVAPPAQDAPASASVPSAAVAAGSAASSPVSRGAVIVTVPRERLSRQTQKPRTWEALCKGVTFFPAGPTRVCLVRDFVNATHNDPRHAQQDVQRWRKTRPRIDHVSDPAHVWQPARSPGCRGSPPWVMSEAAARAVFTALGSS